jgi:hypothetical protein
MWLRVELMLLETLQRIGTLCNHLLTPAHALPVVTAALNDEPIHAAQQLACQMSRMAAWRKRAMSNE